MLLRRVAFSDFCEPSLPSPADKPPAGAGWMHEIKHDGFRMLMRRNACGFSPVMEGVGTALRKRGYPAMDDLKSSKQR
jgi:hypothetical protein